MAQRPVPSHAPSSETTTLSPSEERSFRRWAKERNIRDVDAPESRYDYRGHWKHGRDPHEFMVKQGRHYPDTYKQHGHESFSAESQYSRGPQDGGRWLPGDVLIDPPRRSGRK